jgi:N-methylhydantoinase A
MHTHTIRIGADVGGTFTDVIALDDAGGVRTLKVPSTPPDFEQAVLRAIEALEAAQSGAVSPESGGTPTGAHLAAPSAAIAGRVKAVAHGTTVATNAVLEHRGARTALITTRGFRDVLELRRIRAPQMYNLFWDKPLELVERYLRFEITERMGADGTVVTPLAESELAPLKDAIVREGVESIAVCFLHSYAFPRHEQIVGEYLRRELPAVQVSLSSEVLRERKEYERTSTTVVNAYVRPVMRRYLDALREGLRALEIDAPLLIMQSAGGLTPAPDAALRPVFVLESGPAAGVFAASYVARRLGLQNVMTLDIGGTTAKASLIEDGHIAYSPEYEVGAVLSSGNRLVGGGGDRIRAPSIDIAEVGSGGGSVAFLDRAGGLRVGPRSAGAVPGPACYRRGGTEPTVTDANVVLGYIRPGKLADGAVSIDFESAERVVHDRIAAPLGLSTLAAAEGIHRIANARTMRALRSVSTERGRDPRQFALMAFGGSGPIHAAALARELYIGHVVVPPLPGLFSALGLLFAGVEHHDARSCLLSGDGLTAGALEQMRADMRASMLAQFQSEGFAAEQVSWSCGVDVRFRGQASEIPILLEMTSGAPAAELSDDPFSANTIMALCTAFISEHERLYGHGSDPDNPIEVVAVRLVGQAGAPRSDLTILPAEREGDARAESVRRVCFGAGQGMIEAPVIARRQLAGGMTTGPLLIDEYDSTTVVPPGMRARLDEIGNIVIAG